MHSQFSALGEGSRWRIVELLAEQPRSVGVLADLAGLRQPQATKHLQALERAGIAEVKRVGQRRIYALRTDTLGEMSARLARITDQASANRRAFDEYTLSVDAELLAVDSDRWADGREYVFRRHLEAPRERVWRFVTEPSLMAEWLSPRDLQLAHLEFAPDVGASLQQVYADADISQGGQVVSRAFGEMHSVSRYQSLEFEVSLCLTERSRSLGSTHGCSAVTTRRSSSRSASGSLTSPCRLQNSSQASRSAGLSASIDSPTRSSRPHAGPLTPKGTEIMTTYLHAVVSLDGFIADEHDGVGHLHDWYVDGDYPVVGADSEDAGFVRTSAKSAEYVRGIWTDLKVIVMGRRQFDLTNGWDGNPPAEYVVVVSHRPKPEGWHPEASYHFTSSVQTGSRARRNSPVQEGSQ